MFTSRQIFEKITKALDFLFQRECSTDSFDVIDLVNAISNLFGIKFQYIKSYTFNLIKFLPPSESHIEYNYDLQITECLNEDYTPNGIYYYACSKADYLINGQQFPQRNNQNIETISNKQSQKYVSGTDPEGQSLEDSWDGSMDESF